MSKQCNTYYTKKLFYKKYPFKISAVVPGGSLIKRLGLNRVLAKDINTRWISYTPAEAENLRNFAVKLSPYLNEKIRYEGPHVNIFLTDKTLFDEIKLELLPYIKEIWIPETDNTLNAMQSNNKIIVVNNLPHGIYTHRVTLKENLPYDKKIKLIDWVEKYPNTAFKVSKTTESYLKSETKKWVQNPFILIKDPKMLPLFILAAGDTIRRTEEYVLKDSINTAP